MLCPRCSEKIDPSDRFCPNCAFPLPVVEQKPVEISKSDLPDLAPPPEIPQDFSQETKKPLQPDWKVVHTDQPLPQKANPPKIKLPLLSKTQRVAAISVIITLLIIGLILAYAIL